MENSAHGRRAENPASAVIARMDNAAQPFASAASQSKAKLAAMPAKPAIVATVASAPTTGLAKSPANDMRPKSRAHIGTATAHATADTTIAAKTGRETKMTEKRTTSASANITAKESTLPGATNCNGSYRWTMKNASAHATIESGRRQKSGAMKEMETMMAARTALTGSPVNAT